MKPRKILFGLTSFMGLALLAGCGGSNKIRVEFWTGFGAGVNGTLNPLIERFEAANPEVDIVYESKGGYPNLLQAIKQSISNNAYPHIANGYPDHFAEYANSNVLLNLDSAGFIKNPETGVDLTEFWPDYMKENQELVDNSIMGLPFNKSTEIMVVNQTFFDVAKKLDDTIFVPATWQDLAVVGPKLKAVAADNGWFGKLVKHDGTTVAKPENPTAAELETLKAEVAFDMFNVGKADDFIPFSWDSTSNFFITIIRQWGSLYTERGATLHSGTLKFHEGENRVKTLAALQFFKDLYAQRLVGTPQNFGESLYSSVPFKQGRLVMTISSSAGVKENLPGSSTDFPFDVSIAPIPYNAENPTAKYVISQGTNLALFRRGKATDEKTRLERDAAWRFLRYLTYEVNHEFGKGTSYFPVTDGSKLAVNEEDARYRDYKLYSDFLNATDNTSPMETAIRDTARLQANVYQDAEQAWLKFVDPAFLGSARVRDEIQYVITKLFGGATPEGALDEVVAKLGDFQ